MTSDETVVDASRIQVSNRRFAILIHDHPFVHWDLLLEEDDNASTWRLLESPDRWLLSSEQVTICAEKIAPHRLMYLDYEGPVSRERGRVVRWDSGMIGSWIQDGAMTDIHLIGGKLNGLLRMTGPNPSGQLVFGYWPLAIWKSQITNSQ